MIRRFTHTSVAVADTDTMLGFYRDLLGLEVITDHDTSQWDPQRQQFYKNIHAMPETHFRMTRLKGPQKPHEVFALELKKWYSPPPNPFPDWQRQCDLGLHIIAFFVDDLEATYNKLKEAGVSLISTPQWTTITGCFKCYDPEGNVCEFIARPSGPPPPPPPLPPQPARTEPPMVDFIKHTSIAVQDTYRMLDFYQGLLGLEVMTDTDTEMRGREGRQYYKAIHGIPETHFRMTRLRAPEGPQADFAIELKKWYSPRPRPLPNWQRQNDIGCHIIAFNVQNLEVTYEKLCQAGVKTVNVPQHRPGGGCVKCYDPEGNVVEFTLPPQ
ncbi:MAG: VOC family protein [Chloroflexi bacterium]|nr:VOC family protein [Chloroflexota bacterium]